MTISVIIPTYNEATVIEACLSSLALQSKKHELIIVDDGSTDATIEKITSHAYGKSAVLLKQSHKGPGAARNVGAQKASGEILVFVDADMTFDKNYITDLILPIEESKSRGTFTKSEFVSNWENVWAKAWNFNQGIYTRHRIPEDYPDEAPVFRAILSKEFFRVNGYTEGVGWTDDWTLSRKLGYKSSATAAVCYHANPATLKEVYKQARWIGKNEFLAGNLLRIAGNLFRFSFPLALMSALKTAITRNFPEFIVFKMIYNFAITVSLCESLVGTDKNK